MYFIFAIPISLTLIEPNVHIKSKLDKSFKAIIEIVEFAMLKNKKLKWFIIYSSAMGVATLSMAWFAQPFFLEANILLLILEFFGLDCRQKFLLARIALTIKNITKVLIYISLIMTTLFLVWDQVFLLLD